MNHDCPINHADVSCRKSLVVALSQERIQRLAKGIDNKSNLSEFVMIQDVSSVKYKRWLHHGVVNFLVITRLEFIPSSQNADRIQQWLPEDFLWS